MALRVYVEEECKRPLVVRKERTSIDVSDEANSYIVECLVESMCAH